MKRKISLFIILLLISITSYSQIIKGKICDHKSGTGLPYANIFIKNSLVGTATNSVGEFKLKVKNLKSKIIIKYIGYKTIEIELSTLKTNATNTIKLVKESVMLPQVNINSKEDPAYAIIRKAQTPIARIKQPVHTQTVIAGCSSIQNH